MQFDLGFLGGGQLARMSIQAAQRMGLRCLSIDPDAASPASQVAPAAVGNLNDPDALSSVVESCARITLENEFIPATAIERAFAKVGRNPEALMPGLETLALIQDKLLQREALEKAGLAGPEAVAIEDDGTRAIATIGFPMMLKSRRGGYDGKGARYVATPQDFEDLRSLWQDGGWMAEQYVNFSRELAVMVYRTPQMVGCFPTMETIQTNHVCDLVYPAATDASEVAVAAVEAVQGWGLYGVELFETSGGKILVNEIAPRPHNTGHYTLDWGGPSQFEQHVRVVLGLPPAPMDGLPTCMANLLGIAKAGDWRNGLLRALASDPGIRVHWYGKAESRPGRKMGHLNATGGDIVARARAAREAFYSGWAE